MILQGHAVREPEHLGGLLRGQLPGIPLRAEEIDDVVARLEEEGIVTLEALVERGVERLRGALPYSKSLIGVWVDAASLASIVGERRYVQMRSICLTSSSFVARCKDDQFRKQLAGGDSWLNYAFARFFLNPAVGRAYAEATRR